MNLSSDIGTAFLTGHSFSLAERTALLTAAPLLLSNSKLASVKVWGKIHGYKADYILVQAFTIDVSQAAQTFFSVDSGVTFSVLDVVSDKKFQQIKSISGVFMGDAAYEYRVASADGSFVTVKESERLAWFVKVHDDMCRVAPRGAYLKHEDGTVRQNITFQGLERSEAGYLNLYVHIRKQQPAVSALELEAVNKALDFAQPLTQDIPDGVWTLKADPLRNIVYGETFQFPGAVFYHYPETQQFGNVYIGDGNVCTDMAFIM
jgi:radial spoke head protein 9